ncbi:MAG: glycosyltransferase family protein [Anaerolineaceae bacterium]|nr:glycosyltransferase family protein [Anaerolineaceae bacterium]
MRTIAIIQARMNSSRLPGKVLQEIAGQPMLGWVIERCQLSGRLDGATVATTSDVSDDPIEEFCRSKSVLVFRGDQFDVLDRYYQAARHFEAGVIVRITADCPLIDPQVIDRTLEAFFEADVDFAANRLPPPFRRTYPIGLDTEVCTFAALERAWKEAVEPYEREHVMPYLYDMEGRFRTLLVNHPIDYGAVRLTVDTPEDLAFIRQVFARLDNPRQVNWLDVLALIEREPELSRINAGVRHKTMNDIDARMPGTSKQE